jgi:hypothetical protein
MSTKPKYQNNPINFFLPPHISWKGKTFNQILSSIQYNYDTKQKVADVNYFRALPLNIYRKELNSNPTNVYNPRISVKIADYEQPNGFLENSVCTNTGIQNIDEIYIPNDTDYLPSECQNDCILSRESVALRRVRSSGMVQNKTLYSTNTNQYLERRNKTFKQNQFNYIRQGDPLSKPGTTLAKNNVYSPNGMRYCKPAVISVQLNNNTFQYIWIDGSINTVVLPNGEYNIDQLNLAFQNVMIQNTHYYIYEINYSYYFLLYFSYDTSSEKVTLNTILGGQSAISSTTFYVDPNATWENPPGSVMPYFVIEDTAFQNVVGFTTGVYPSQSTTWTSNQTVESTISYTIQPMYSQVFYKPNNPQFAVEGAVSSSTLITRIKYNTITDNTARLQLGQELVDQLTYSVPKYGYTEKDKKGYPMKCTPRFSKYTDGYTACMSKSTMGI